VAARLRHPLVRERMGAEGAISNYEQDDPANEADPVLFEAMKSEMSVIPKAATMPLTISQDAALTPITRPYRAPCSSVRRMQRMPTGPIGAPEKTQ